ncbi:MAG: GGDEF domain-containing protein [Aquitalea sp.]|nr:GGDEF domain-containing protein [Aquitalea sp.]
MVDTPPASRLDVELVEADKIAWYRLAFPPLLEKIYQRETRSRRFGRYRLFGAIGILVFMLYGLVDKFYLSDVYPLIYPWRFYFLPGFSLLTILLGYWPPFQRWYELSVVVAHTAYTLALIWFFSLSQMPAAQHYYSGVMMCLVFTMFGLRIPFRLACYGSLLCIGYLGLVLSRAQFMDDTARSLIFILMLSCVWLSLLGLFQLEKEARRNYLLTLALQRDHLQLQHGFRQLQQLSAVDSLTGLFNRGYFDQQLQQHWSSRLQLRHDIALLFVDVDDFKKYNDSQGHQMGDTALIRVAQVLSRNATRYQACPARYGGEEFVLLLLGCDLQQAVELAEQIRHEVEALALPHPRSQCSAVVTISVGIAAAHYSINQPSEWLVRTADAALYQAKQQGRNRIVSMHACQPRAH